MASTTDYCTDQDLIDRARPAGVLSLGDDDGSGTLSAAEQAALVTAAKQYATKEIESYVGAIQDVPVTQDTGSLNRFLRDVAIDIGVYRMAGRGAAGVPQVVIDDKDAAYAKLKAVVAGTIIIPGWTYPTDGRLDERRAIGRPLAANPRGGRCMPRRRGW